MSTQEDTVEGLRAEVVRLRRLFRGLEAQRSLELDKAQFSGWWHCEDYDEFESRAEAIEHAFMGGLGTESTPTSVRIRACYYGPWEEIPLGSDGRPA